MPKSKFSEPPRTGNLALDEFLLDLFNRVFGVGANVTGDLDDDNLSEDFPNLTDDENVTGQWTFTEHPLGLDHTKIANIGTNTHPQIDIKITELDTHVADGSVHMTDAEAAVIAEAAVTTHEAEVNPHGQYQLLTEKGVASGYASLEADTKVTVTQLRNPVYIGVSAPDPTEYPLWLDIS